MATSVSWRSAASASVADLVTDLVTDSTPQQTADRVRERLFAGDPGNGMFAGHPREFVLSDPTGNLWAGIRDDALEYIANHFGIEKSHGQLHQLDQKIGDQRNTYPRSYMEHNPAPDHPVGHLSQRK